MRNLVIRASFITLCFVSSAFALTGCGDDSSDADTSTGGSANTGGGTNTGGSDTGGGNSGGGSATGGGSSDGGSAGAGTGGGSSDTAGTCDTTVEPSPNTIPETQKNDAVPTPAGGEVQDGLYYLSSFEVYAPASADDHVRARLLEISDGKIAAMNVDDGGVPELNAGTFTVSGSEMTITTECPGVSTISIAYTATATSITFYDEEPNAQVYTKQ